MQGTYRAAAGSRAGWQNCNLRPGCVPFMASTRSAHLNQQEVLRLASKASAKPAAQAQVASVSPDPQSFKSKLHLHNSMTRTKEPFQPRPDQGDHVSMYVCGVTVYDYSHIGHARVYVAFDILYRYLKHIGYDVQYVRNFTDVDDKIIARANERGEDPLALSQRFINEFHTDMLALNCLAPTSEPKATDYIPQMIKMIEDIISNGHGYVVEGGDVNFDVGSLPGYGRLSGRSQEDNRAGERVAVDSRKRNPADFALWKAAKPGEISWPSPWGPGRPGWHIECSAMIRSLMGNVIDIHGGGRDLVFPHHENELAQSQAACSCCTPAGHSHRHSQGGHDAQNELHNATDFVRYWVHNGFVNVDSEKMSKSLGNFFTIREVLARYHALALRWFLVSSQYRAPVNYSDKALEEASARLYYVLQAMADVDAALLAAGADGASVCAAAAADTAAGRGAGAALASEVAEALADDLNTPAALSALSAPLKTINDLLTTKAGKKQPNRLSVLSSIQEGLWRALALLGVASGSQGQALLGSEERQQWLSSTIAALRSLALARCDLTEEQVSQAIEARAQARAAKDFAAADKVRVDLAAKGVLLLDTPQGTTWRPGGPSA